jgi:hypothetical protein
MSPGATAGSGASGPPQRAGRPVGLRGSWAPVVVGDPILDFEPKPPLLRPYQADTIYDGWSSPAFTMRLASVRGYSRRYAGTPRQDEAEVAYHSETGALVFAVASAEESHVGAAAACRASVDTMLRQLSSPRPSVTWQQVVKAVVGELHAWAAYLLHQEEMGEEVLAGMLATTLTAGFVVAVGQDSVADMIQIGDCGAWILRNGKYHPVLAQEHDQGTDVMPPAVSPLPRMPDHLAPIRIRLAPDAVLLVGTDGFGDPLGDGDGKLGQLFAQYLAIPPPPRGLAHLLDFSMETFDDDRTLVAIWPRPGNTASTRNAGSAPQRAGS